MARITAVVGGITPGTAVGVGLVPGPPHTLSTYSQYAKTTPEEPAMKQQTPHRRAQVLRAALAAVEERRDTRVPTDLPGVAATVGDELALLGALTLRWHTRLAGLVEREQQRTPRDPVGATERAWARAADEMPGLRALLDHHRAHPRDDRTAEATVRATATEHALLAVAAGRAEVGDPRAAGAGAAVEQAARARRLAGLTTLAARAADDGAAVALASYRPRRGLLGRLRSLVAA